MKKLNLFLCMLIFGIFASFVGSFNNTFLSAEEEVIQISNLQSFIYELNLDTTGKIYELGCDLDFTGADCSAFPLKQFSGTLRGNGYEISNVKITGNSESGEYGIFSSLNNAKIENIKFNGIEVKAESVNTIIKAGVIAGSITTSDIVNCSIDNFVLDDEITQSKVESKSTATEFIGLVCGEANDGSLIQNIRVSGNINATQTGINTAKEFFVGGAVGKVFSSTLTNVVSDVVIETNVESQDNTSVGGLIGVFDGNKAQISNTLTVLTLNTTGDVLNIGGVVGKISTSSDMPASNSITGAYTTSTLVAVGNINEMSSNYVCKAYNSVAISSAKTKSFYTEEDKWNSLYEWNFNTVWLIDEKLNLPKLQRFETFSYTFNEDNSFIGFTKPSLDSSIIVLTENNDDFKYEYGQTLTLEAHITNQNNLHKFFEIVGIQKGSDVVYSNNKILSVVNNGQLTEESGVQKYTYGADTVYVKASANAETYILEGSNIVWTKITNGDVVSHKYEIENCNMSDEGIYSFVLNTIDYKLTVKTENVDFGTVRRSSADSSSKNEVIEETITYGQSLQFFATPTSDYAFNAWTLKLPEGSEELVSVENKQTFSKVFTEQLFLDGGLFEGYNISEDALELYATFTKNVCKIVFKFGINSEIQNDILSQVYVDNKLVEPDENGELSLKVKLGSTHQVRVILASGYEFGGWFESNGTSNIGDLSDSEEMTITASSEEEEMIIVSNFLKDVPKETGDSSTVWLIVGCSVALVVLGVVIFFLVRKKKDNSYKNLY